MNIGYCSGYFMNIVKYLKMIALLSARMNACLERVPPTGLSCSSLNIGPRMLECIGLSVSRS